MALTRFVSFNIYYLILFILFCVIPLIKLNTVPTFSGARVLIFCTALTAWFIIFARNLKKREVKIRFTLIDLLIFLFYGVYFLSCLISDNPDVSFTAFQGEFVFFIVYSLFRVFMLDRPGYPGSIKITILSVTISVVLLSLWGMAQYFFEFDVSSGLKTLFKTHHFPVVASLGNPNFLSELLVLSIPAVFSFSRQNRKTYPAVLLTMLLGITVYFTYSRLAWFTMALSIIILLFISRDKERKTVMAVLVSLAVMNGSFFIYHYITGSSKAQRIIKSVSIPRRAPLAERSVIYKSGFNMMKDAGMLGMGPGLFAYRYLDYQGDAILGKRDLDTLHRLVDLDHAHCDLIELGVESGYIGMSVFVFLLIYVAGFGIMNFIRSQDSDTFVHVGLIPLLFIPFSLWSFPFFMPHSKLLLYFSLAYLASNQRPVLEGKVRLRVAVVLATILLLSFLYFNIRYICSVQCYRKGTVFMERDVPKAFDYFSRGIRWYPYNGYNYFSMGALLLNRGNIMGIYYVKESLKYLTTSSTYINLARGYSEHGNRDRALKWYEKVISIRPDINQVRREYKELLDTEK